MTTQPLTDTAVLPPPHRYFVDESGDGVIFDGRGRLLIGTGKVQDYFMLGMVECADLPALETEFLNLRATLLAEPYFKGVPSMQPQQGKTALMFHAKDDLPEVRREVFKLLERHDFRFYAIVHTMAAVHQRVVRKNLRDPTYRYQPTELYDSAVRRLFDKKLHSHPHYQVIFASRGKARTRSLRDHLLHAQSQSQKAIGSYADASLEVLAMPASTNIGLQVTDYCLWAVQRLFIREEERYLGLIWPHIALLVDADDISERPYGTYYTQKRAPLDLSKIKSRKVEDLRP